VRIVAAALLLASSQMAGAQSAAFTPCAACHAEKGGPSELGPSLNGVYGRKAGSLEDFRYSRPLSRSGVVWNEQTLDAFIKAPQQFIPGTRMPFEGVASDAERAAIIQHLKTLK
jgi:cytochrome c